MSKLLSIIIPAYNAEPYLTDLLAVLKPQMTDEVELIIIDDGSKVPVKCDFAKVIRERNGSPGISRNLGLENMTGEYFTFIDADDMVAADYIKRIIDKIKAEQFDYCYLSWKTMSGSKWSCAIQLKSADDKFPPFNLCVWNRVYKTSVFGKHRFNPKKLWSEDADYIYRLNEHGKKSFISEYLYFYRSDTPGSWTKQMFNGQLDYRRIVYNVPTVTEQIRDEIIEEYENNEIVLLTNNNPFKELERYAMCMSYNQAVSGSELRGDMYSGFRKIPHPIRTQVVIWTAFTQAIGGIETWIYNFCKVMSKYYDIMVLYDHIDAVQLARLQKIVRCMKQDEKKSIVCDTIIVSRITDKIPANIKAEQSVQMVHACKMVPSWSIPQDKDKIVAVSEAVKRSFSEDKAEVIYNLVDKPTSRKSLLLISATRLSTKSAFEKGHDRMRQLAKMLHQTNIPFLWIIFSDDVLRDADKNMVVLPPTLDIAPYLAKADYYVSLSDAEGYGYSMVEALINGTALITTPVTVLPEIGVQDGLNAYIVPFDMDFDVNILLDVPTFKYKRLNTTSIKKWRSILGNSEPKHDYKPDISKITVKIIKTYYDMNLDRTLKPEEVVLMDKDRAELIQNKGYGRIIYE